MKQHKKIITSLLAVNFLLQPFNVLSASAYEWVLNKDNSWSYKNDTGKIEKDKWVQNNKGQWFYLNKNGIMDIGFFTDINGNTFFLDNTNNNSQGVLLSGWKMINNDWYYFNEEHNGFFGKMATGWNWIDGNKDGISECYFFASDGKLFINKQTPDGYNVNKNGAWIENGIVKTKRISVKSQITQTELTKTNNRIGGSGGSGGGGGSRKSTHNQTTDTKQNTNTNENQLKDFSYTVKCIDKENGSVLMSETKTAKENTTLLLTYNIDGFTYESGIMNPVLNQNNQEFILYFTKNKTNHTNNETTKQFNLTVNYIDENGKIIKTVSTKYQNNTAVKFIPEKIDGVNILNVNEQNIFMDSDKTINVYCQTIEEIENLTYTISFVGTDNKNLGYFTSKCKKNDLINPLNLNFDGYERITDTNSVKITKNNQDIIIKYKPVEKIQKATDSNVERENLNYTLLLKNKETDTVIGELNNQCESGKTIKPNFNLDGLKQFEDYNFKVNENNQTFTMYYINLNTDIKYNYTIKCIDENGNVIKLIKGQLSQGTVINPTYEIDGFEIRERKDFTISNDNQEIIVKYINKNKFKTLTVNQIDIDSGQTIGQLKLKGIAGETVHISPNLDGFDMVSNSDLDVVLSNNDVNNVISLYYKKKVEYQETKKSVLYTVEFLSKDGKTKIQSDYKAQGLDGEKIPITFQKYINAKDGKKWMAIDDSPRTFTLEYGTSNIFRIRYINVGEMEIEEIPTAQYIIKYVADDTGAVLGIASGYGKVGDEIEFRNNFNEYTFKDHTSSNASFTITENDINNRITVKLRRISFPAPEKDTITGKYKGFNFDVLFIDENGQSLLPVQSGFSLDNKKLVIDYPDTIDIGDGYIYRAEIPSPLNKVFTGTAYRKITIKYIKGEKSDEKLEKYKTMAQRAKDNYLNRTPADYQIICKELNSWNDIALITGKANIGSFINVPTYDLNGFKTPNTATNGLEINGGLNKTSVNYERFDASQSSSISGTKQKATIHFKGTDGTEILPDFQATLAKMNSRDIIEFPVYFQETITDIDGNIWKAQNESPFMFKLEPLHTSTWEQTITYKKVYSNDKKEFFVTNTKEGLNILQNYFSMTSDENKKELYLIGDNYNTNDIIPNELLSLYNIHNYTTENIDEFNLDGHHYYITKVSFKKGYDSINGEHKWVIETISEAGCDHSGFKKIVDKRTGESYEVIMPATGHIDKNNDGLCDICGTPYWSTNVGDEIKITFDSKDRGLGVYEYKFLCIDDDYDGKMLYISEDDIPSNIYGEYSKLGNSSFELSDLRIFLNDIFVDGTLQLKNVLKNVSNDRVSLMSIDDIKYYSDINVANMRYVFPSGVFLTKSNENGQIILSNGQKIDVSDAKNYPIRPTIVLDKPTKTTENIERHWNIGDLQIRTIGNKEYIFRCVDTNYKDKSGTSKKLAYFLCESVIPADIIDDKLTENYETQFFGDTNNYKYSVINKWLENNSTDALFGLNKINIGVDTSFKGNTGIKTFNQFRNNELVKSNFGNTQTMYSSLFIPSVEEAINYKDKLWKFEISDKENPSTQIRQFCKGYYLRTPETGTNDKVYYVDLEKGNINTISTHKTDNNDYSEIGIRPAFVIPQYE